MRQSEGFSIVEVIVAMFLLMVLALAVLPLIIGATGASVANRELAAVTSFAHAQLAPVAAAFPNDPTTPTSCAALHGRVSADIPDPGGSGMTADLTVGGCPAAYPGTVVVTVAVEDPADPGSPLLRLASRVSVSGP